jgi:hypothetical protein
VTTSIQLRTERLRGGLPAEEPGARGIERVARNPECFKLKALTIVGITPATAIKVNIRRPGAAAGRGLV